MSSEDIRSRIVFRTAKKEDYVHVNEWWEESIGYCETLSMMDHMRKFAGDGAFVAELDGQIVGHAFAVRLGDDNVMMGYFVVRKDMRRHGIGGMINKKRHEYSHGRNISLYSVPDRIARNKKLGFKVISFWLHFFTGPFSREPIADAKVPSGCNIVGVDKISLPQLIRYDTAIHAWISRESLITDMVNDPEMKCLVCIKNNNEIVGYTIMRKAKGLADYLINPLYGDTFDVQKALLKNVLDTLPDGTNISLATPEDNSKMCDLIFAMGVESHLYVPRMYTKFDLPLPLRKIGSVLELDVVECSTDISAYESNHFRQRNIVITCSSKKPNIIAQNPYLAW